MSSTKTACSGPQASGLLTRARGSLRSCRLWVHTCTSIPSQSNRTVPSCSYFCPGCLQPRRSRREAHTAGAQAQQQQQQQQQPYRHHQPTSRPSFFRCADPPRSHSESVLRALSLRQRGRGGESIPGPLRLLLAGEGGLRRERGWRRRERGRDREGERSGGMKAEIKHGSARPPTHTPVNTQAVFKKGRNVAYLATAAREALALCGVSF